LKGHYPVSLDSPARRALYDNLDCNEELAIRIDTAVRDIKKDGWRGNRFKEREVMNAVREELGAYVGKAEAIFELVKNQRGY
jgi:type I restriction enzyme R subunit